ncbi:MAG: DUF5667 domain-containing protein [bacterium]|nr:DUF5667 domain-containing protein [bacterium]
MLRRAAIVFVSLLFGFAVLITSILRTALPNYAFSQAMGNETSTPFVSNALYYLPYPGILPDHFLWGPKAFRDKLWLVLTRDTMKRAELMLLFADKRVGMAKVLIEGGKPEPGVSTARRGEQYLEEAFNEQEKARAKGLDTSSFLNKLARSSLKHREVLESIMVSLPEEAKPVINQIIDTPKKVYEKAVQQLNEKGRPVPGMALEIEKGIEATPSSMKK